MQSLLDDCANIAGADLLRRRLAAAAEQATVTLGMVDLDDAPVRDRRVYRYDDESKRSRDSHERFDDLMTVACLLANQLEEHIESGEVRSDFRISLLLDGWWANSFTLIAAIQRVLQTKVPKTAQRLSDERVFRDPAPANELLGRFKELADIGRDGPAPPPKRKITIFGQDHTDENAAGDLLLGTSGVLGQRLKEKAVSHLFQPGLAKRGREIVVLPKRSKAGGGSGGGAGTRENRKDRELAGLLGEAFVYEQLRITLSGFDEMAWRSCNRNAYGLQGEGDDSLGFDFIYRDIENQLAGRGDCPLCCIEVKATSGNGSEAFPMSANEWEKARECHQSTDSVYMILRVEHVREDPRISDMIIDAFGLYGEGHVGIVSRDMWVHVGAAQSANDVTAQQRDMHALDQVS